MGATRDVIIDPNLGECTLCTRCNEYLMPELFSPRISATSSRLSAYCKPCMAAYRREWRATKRALTRGRKKAAPVVRGPERPSAWEHDEVLAYRKRLMERERKSEAMVKAAYRLLVALYPIGTRVLDPDCAFHHRNLGTVMGHHPATGCVQVHVDRDHAAGELWIFAGCLVAADDMEERP